MSKLPEMRRVKYIRQLGFTYLQFPSANHVRFDHCIGTLIASDRLCNHLMSEGIIDIDQTTLVRIVALIHDIGHGAFSHLSERLWKIISAGLPNIPYTSHEDISLGLISGRLELNLNNQLLREVRRGRGRVRQEIDRTSTSVNEIERVLNGSAGFLSQIIAGPLDIDRMDYLLRDSYFTGIALGFNRLDSLHNLIDGFTIYESDLVLNESKLMSAIHLIFARDVLYPSVYMHSVPRSANAMLVRAFEINYENCRKQDLYKVIFGKTDDQLLCEMERSSDARVTEIASNLRYGPLYYRIFREGIRYDQINNNVRDEIEGACLAERLIRGNAQANLREIEKRVEEIIITELSIEDDHKHRIIVDIPEIPRLDEIGAKILFTRGGRKHVRTIEEYYAPAQALASEHVKHWSAEVFVSRSLWSNIRRIRNLANQLFVDGKLADYL